jgi:excisionase family DNA binding protein
MMQATATAPHQPYTKFDLAHLFGLSTRTIERMTHTHVMGQIRVGRHVRYSRPVIDRILNEGGVIQPRKLYTPKPKT